MSQTPTVPGSGIFWVLFYIFYIFLGRLSVLLVSLPSYIYTYLSHILFIIIHPQYSHGHVNHALSHVRNDMPFSPHANM